MHVKTLSSEDGRQNIVEATKDIVSAGATKIKTDTLSELFRKDFKFPNPDFGIICCSTFCADGYPPWEMRFTEFHKIKTHYNLTVSNFIDILYRFNNSAQNYGK